MPTIRSVQKRTANLAMCLAFLGASASPPALAGGEGADGTAKRASSSTVASYAAACIGAGTALVITSQCVEREYEKVTGYYETPDRVYPITVYGGSDTDGLLVAGASLLALGAMLIVAPMFDGDGGKKAHAAGDGSSVDDEGMSLATVALDRKTTGVGVALGF